MPTIEDVAKVSGLSRTTVSRVINNHPYVSETKRKKVMDAMNMLGYVPNSAARSLRRQKTGMIAVFIPYITNSYFSKLIETMEITASDHDYQIIICQTRNSAQKELHYLNLLKTKQVDGVILASVENDWELIEPYLEFGPIVLCNEYVETAKVPMIYFDQVDAGYKATKHLIDQGHKRIGYCFGRSNSSMEKSRQQGFIRAINEYNLAFDRNYVFPQSLTINDGKEIFHKIRTMHNKPTAIFADCDEVAAGLILEAKKYGFDIPKELAVIGIDTKQTLAEVVQPALSTIDQPISTLAKASFSIIIEKIFMKNFSFQEKYKFPVKLITRETTIQTNKQLLSAVKGKPK